MITRLVKGEAVIRLEDGKQLGLIDHVFFDPKRWEVTAISVRDESILFHRKPSRLLSINAIHAIGEDAITISTAHGHCLPTPEDPICAGLVDLDTLVDRPVFTPRGVMLGRVMAIRFSQNDFRITHIGVAHTKHEPGRLISAHHIQQLDGDVILVDDPVRTISRNTLAVAA